MRPPPQHHEAEPAFRDFVFLAGGRPWAVKMHGARPWLFWCHPDRKWVSRTPLTQQEVWDFAARRIPDEHAALYEPEANDGAAP